MYGLWLVVFLVASFCLMTQGQLTFSSGWGGKRSMFPTMQCLSDETVGDIYKMIQKEAEKLLACQKS